MEELLQSLDVSMGNAAVKRLQLVYIQVAESLLREAGKSSRNTTNMRTDKEDLSR
jgi:hypothetical protein